jgi:peptidoglycan/LPS O-acetylase OafA/YrhL
MTTSPPPKYLAWIDQVKGISILGIVLFHFFQNYPLRVRWIDDLYHLGAKVGFAAVCIFFVIAGFNTSYVLARKIDSKQTIDWGEWLKKRLLRIYPPYWLAIAVTLILYYLFKSSHSLSQSELFLIAIGYPNYGLFRAINPGFWFFSVILQYYLIAPLIFKLAQNNAKIILWMGIEVSLFIKLACIFVIPRNNWLFGFLYQLNFVGSYFFEICLGIYWGFIFYKYQKFRPIDILNSTAIFIVGLIVYFGLFFKGIDTAYNLGFDILFTPVIFLLCYWIVNRTSPPILPKIKFPLLIILGKYSYQIYLLHQPLLFVLLPIWGKHNFFSSFWGVGIVLVTTAIALTFYIAGFTKLESGLNYLLWQRHQPGR